MLSSADGRPGFPDGSGFDTLRRNQRFDAILTAVFLPLAHKAAALAYHES